LFCVISAQLLPFTAEHMQVPFLLDQLQQVQGAAAAAAGRHPFAGRPLVILADAAKDDMDATVRRCWVQT
jgi:hypothetical protein